MSEYRPLSGDGRADGGQSTTETDRVEAVEYERRFAQNLPIYLSGEDTTLRIKAAVLDGLSQLWDEHGRLDNIEIETNVHRSRLEPQCSHLEVSIEAESVRWSK